MANNLIDRGWNRKVKLTVSKAYISADQTNFPIMLIWNGISGNIPNEVYNNSSISPKSDGRDIRFSSDFGGNTELPFEIETFVPNSTASNARVVIHVKLPSLYTAIDTPFYMWWGNGDVTSYANTDTFGRNNVWTNGYLGVFHLNESSGPGAENSTGGLDGTYSGTSFPNQMDSSYGYSQNFVNANANRVEINDAASWSIAGNISLSATLKVGSWDSTWQTILAKGDEEYRLHRYSATNYGSFGRNYSGGKTDTSNTNVNINDGEYHHFLGVYNTTIGTYLYVDGTSGGFDSNTSATLTGSQTLCIGRNTQNPARDWNGSIGEIRICNASRTASWATAEYFCSLRPTDFITSDYVNNVDFSEIGCNL
jgi:hypothetical protein